MAEVKDGDMVVIDGIRVRVEDADRIRARVAKAKEAAKLREKANEALRKEAERRQDDASQARGASSTAPEGENPSGSENGAPGAAYALLSDDDVRTLASVREVEEHEDSREAAIAALVAQDEARAAAGDGKGEGESGDGGEQSGEGDGGDAGAKPIGTSTAKAAPKRGSRSSTK